MTLLLDTHVWLWAVEAPDKLGRRTKALLLKSSEAAPQTSEGYSAV